jgi:WD40-like Beta Propeller Repeat
LVSASVALLAPATALGSFPGEDGVIAYSAGGSIWAVNPTTGQQRQLTAGHDDSEPSFSASGSMLVFQRYSQGTVTVYISRADGSQPRPLIRGSQPAFSPNGKEIVFVRADGLYLTGLARGSPVRRLTNHPGDREPSWSSTGSIAFQRTNLRQVKGSAGTVLQGQQLKVLVEEIDVMTPPSHRVNRVLTYDRDVDMWPDWSPNGTTLAVTLCLPYEGEGVPQLLQGQPPSLPTVVLHSSCYRAVWAPDGRSFAERGVGLLSGRPGTSCPRARFIEGPISWQPLVAGTQPVSTRTCTAEHGPIESEPQAATGIVTGTKTCIRYSRRLHRKVCFEI